METAYMGKVLVAAKIQNLHDVFNAEVAWLAAVPHPPCSYHNRAR